MISNSFICVIDDDPDIQEIVTLVLEASGYRVVVASDGAEALDVLRSDPGTCRVILLDLMMPGLNGWEFRALQEKDPRLASIPVLVISSIRELSRHASQLHAAAYLQKPVDIDRLLTEVERHA